MQHTISFLASSIRLDTLASLGCLSQWMAPSSTQSPELEVKSPRILPHAIKTKPCLLSLSHVLNVSNRLCLHGRCPGSGPHQLCSGFSHNLQTDLTPALFNLHVAARVSHLVGIWPCYSLKIPSSVLFILYTAYPSTKKSFLTAFPASDHCT